MTMANEHHNRLDMMLGTLEFSGAGCGSLNLLTAERMYCSAECPARNEDVPLSDIHKMMAGLPYDPDKARLESRGGPRTKRREQEVIAQQAEELRDLRAKLELLEAKVGA